MKIYRVIIVIALLLISFVAPAQVELRNSAEVYNYWTKRGIIELVYAYMNDVKEARSEKSEAFSEAEGYEYYLDTFIKDIAQKKPNEIDLIYKKIPLFLDTNDWSGTREDLFDVMNSNRETGMPFEEVFNANLSEYSEGEKWKSKLNEIQNGYRSYKNSLDTISENKVVVEGSTEDENGGFIQNGGDQQKVKGGGKMYPPREDNSFWHWFIYLGVFLLGVVIGLVYRTKQAINKEVKLNRQIAKLNTQIAKMSGDNVESELRQEIQAFKDKIYSLELSQRKRNELKTEVRKGFEENKQQNVKQEEISQEKAELLKSIYLGMPEDDGSFYIDQATNSPETRSYFEIKYKSESNNGELIYRGGSLDVSALNQMDFILEPVCNIINPSYKSPRKVKVLKNGTVRKVDDKWVVDRKVEIELV